MKPETYKGKPYKNLTNLFLQIMEDNPKLTYDALQTRWYAFGLRVETGLLDDSLDEKELKAKSKKREHVQDEKASKEGKSTRYGHRINHIEHHLIEDRTVTVNRFKGMSDNEVKRYYKEQYNINGDTLNYLQFGEPLRTPRVLISINSMLTKDKDNKLFQQHGNSKKSEIDYLASLAVKNKIKLSKIVDRYLSGYTKKEFLVCDNLKSDPQKHFGNIYKYMGEAIKGESERLGLDYEVMEFAWYEKKYRPDISTGKYEFEQDLGDLKDSYEAFKLAEGVRRSFGAGSGGTDGTQNQINSREKDLLKENPHIIDAKGEIIYHDIKLESFDSLCEFLAWEFDTNIQSIKSSINSLQKPWTDFEIEKHLNKVYKSK